MEETVEGRETAHPAYHSFSLRGRRMPSTVMLAKRQLDALVRRNGYDGVLVKVRSEGKRGTVEVNGRMPTASITGVLDRLGCNYELSERKH